jgi:hypothetical protein
MPKTDDDALGPALERRLRSELNRVQPRFSSPRYASAAHPAVRTWRLAPVALGVSLVSMLALSGFVATGSANPVVWTQRVVTVIESNPPPTSEPSPAQPKAAPQAGAEHTPEQQAPATSEPREGSETPEPGRTPEPTVSPGPADSHSGSDGSGDSSHFSPAPIDR